MELLYRIQWQLYRPFARSYFRLSIRGLNHIPSSGPVLLAANHCSFLDPPLIGLGVPRQIAFLAKEELFSVPVFGRWIRTLGAYPVARGKGGLRAIKTALRLLKEGHAVLVFPEGTRSSNGQLIPFEDGLAWLSIKTGTEVIPIFIGGTYRALPRNAWIPKPVKVRIQVGEPIPPPSDDRNRSSSESVSEMNQRIRKAILELKEKLNEEVKMNEKPEFPSSKSLNTN